MLGRVMKLEPLHQPPRLRGFKGFVESRRGMNVQVVHDHPNPFRARKMHIRQFTHLFSKINPGPPFGHRNVTPALERLERGKQVASSVPLIFIVVTHRLTWFGGEWLACFADQLIRAFVEADHRKARIIGLRIEVEHIFHVPHKVWTDAWNAPLVP